MLQLLKTLLSVQFEFVCPVFSFICFRLQLLSQAAPPGSHCVHYVRVSVCVCMCVYLSLDLFLGAMCLSPPDCSPVVVGSVFRNLSLAVCACARACACIWKCGHRRCCEIYQCLTTVGLSWTILRYPPPGVLSRAPGHRSGVLSQSRWKPTKAKQRI